MVIGYKNSFTSLWQEAESTRETPRFTTDIVVMPYDEFRDQVMSDDPATARRLVDSFYSGVGYILKGAFDRDWLRSLIDRTHDWGLENPSGFYKMIDGCPDYHRAIDAEQTRDYSMHHIKQSHYFFPWNDDPLDLFDEVNRRWRVFKFLGGYPSDAYERNVPSDGIIDRLQVVRYPTGGGALESHTDPTQNQKIVIGALMSERGADYSQGGFYFVSENGKSIDCEPMLSVGDMLTGSPTVVHGVAPIDPDRELDWKSKEGRWFLGLYSNDSDEMPKRMTAKSLGDQFPSPVLPLADAKGIQ